MTDDPAGGVSEAIAAAFAELPYAALVGVEVTDARDGRARAELELREALRPDPDAPVAHTGAVYALADTVAGAAMVSRHLGVTPTVDMRIEFLAPATTDLTATAEVVRDGGSVAAVDVVVTGADGVRVATARGTFKATGSAGKSPWTAGRTDDHPE